MNEKEKLVPKRRFKEFKNSDAWEQRKLGEISESYSGGTPSVANQSYYGGSIPFIRSAEINSKNTELYLTEAGLNNSSAKLVEEGDILYALYGATSGEVGISQINGAINQAILAIKPKIEYDSNFIMQWLRRQKNSIISTYLQGGQGNLSGGIVKDLTLYAPTEYEEQTTIGSFFKQLDDAIALHQRKLDKAKALKSAYLSEMFPVEDESKPKRRFAGFTDDWKQWNLNDMCSIITKQTGFDYSATIKPSLLTAKENGSYPFIQNKDFNGDNINLDTDFYIPVEIAEKFPKIILDVPSLLISISGKIGNVGLYNLSEKAFIGGAVGICKLKNSDEGALIIYALQSDSGQANFRSLTKSSSHANITIEDIRKIEVKLPVNIIEQKKITHFFHELNSRITLHQHKLDKLQNIKKAYLNEMFI